MQLARMHLTADRPGSRHPGSRACELDRCG